MYSCCLLGDIGFKYAVLRCLRVFFDSNDSPWDSLRSGLPGAHPSPCCLLEDVAAL